MNNTDVADILVECETEVNHIITIVNATAFNNAVIPYLTKFAIIRTCGAIERSYKIIVADFCMKRSKKQIKTYLSKKVVESSSNPTFSNICNLLLQFDSDWNTNFKDTINSLPNAGDLKISLQSLVDARNDFAHGGNPSITINDVFAHFKNSITIIEKLDDVVN